MNEFCEYMDTDCTKCKHAEWDCEEYFGGGKEYFVCGCNRDADLGADECEEYEEFPIAVTKLQFKEGNE